MEALGVKDEELVREAPDMVGRGSSGSTAFQHGDGGFGWWEHDETHPYMTPTSSTASRRRASAASP